MLRDYNLVLYPSRKIRLSRNSLLIVLLLSSTCLGAQDPGKTSHWTVPEDASARNIIALPTTWNLQSGVNIRWVAKLGSETYSSPVVAGGKVFIGTNNGFPRNPSNECDMGVLMVFRESDGKFLWQALSEKLVSGSAQDWPKVGVSSTPLVVGERVYYINNRDELVALDTEGFLDQENDGPFQTEAAGPRAADEVWILDLIEELGVHPHNASHSSPVFRGDLLFVGTSNGRNEDHSRVPAPEAPSLIAVNRLSGKVLWSDNSPGAGILNGQWTSPIVARIGGTDQVIIGQGDGWVRSFKPETGKLLWEFNTNPKDSIYPETRNSILSTPGVLGDFVYIANGQDPENGEGKGYLYCIDATKRGDITERGLVWSYSGIRRSVSNPVLHEGLLYYPDFSGFLHCLDAFSGRLYWVHDTFAAVWGSPTIADSKLYLGNEDGEVVVLALGKTEKVLAKNDLGSSVYSTPGPANQALFIATRDKLFSLALTK